MPLGAEGTQLLSLRERPKRKKDAASLPVAQSPTEDQQAPAAAAAALAVARDSQQVSDRGPGLDGGGPGGPVAAVLGAAAGAPVAHGEPEAAGSQHDAGTYAAATAMDVAV